MLDEQNVVDVHTNGENESFNQSTEEVMSEGGDSTVPVSKKPHLAINILTKTLENRYHEFNIGHHNITFGKSVVEDEFVKCGLVKLFDDIGMLPLIQLSDAGYPALAQEFYMNLHIDKYGDFVSKVRDQGIYLNASVLNGKLKLRGFF